MRRAVGQIVIILAAGGAGAGGLYYAQTRSREARIRTLQQQLQDRDRQLRQTEQALQKSEEELRATKEAIVRLTRQQRRAELKVLAVEDRQGVPYTKLCFTELDDGGRPIGDGRTFNVEGQVVYIDALIVKFNDKLVIDGHAERGHPLLLFRRAFGEKQSPESGYMLDEVSHVPHGYRTDKPMPEWEKKLWADFWKVARHPEDYAGVRSAHGKAPYTRVEPGRTYVVTLRADGEMGFDLRDDRP